MQIHLFYIAVFILISFFILFLFLILNWRWLIKRIVRNISSILFTDSYQENLLELLPGMRHVGLQNILENNLRSATGDLIHRPLGSSKTWPHFDTITFIPTQTTPFPVASDELVDLSVTIGPKANRPLHINIPLMVSGMAYGVGVSEEVRLSLATAANKLDTAINSGEGGILKEELEKAGKYILQYSTTPWGKNDAFLQRADMIEIKLGQGAKFGIGTKISPENLTGRARDIMELEEDEDAIIYEHFFENQTLSDLKGLVDDLREITGGIPIGVKIGAGGKIEEDIDQLLQLEIDFITIDGGQAATHAGAPILADDFGIPTLHAVVRAANHLQKREVKDQVSLILSGGLIVPGHFLKALALGADAVYLGSALLFAVAHEQITTALPFEPPTQVVWNEGKFSHKLDDQYGAESAENFLKSSVEEMKVALRAMGKHSLKQLSKKDLVSYDYLTAKMVKIPYTFKPIKRTKRS